MFDGPGTLAGAPRDVRARGRGARTWSPNRRPGRPCSPAATEYREMKRAASRTPARPTPCVDAHAVEHVDKVLGSQVAGRAGCVRAAAGPARDESKQPNSRRPDPPGRWPARCRACRGSGTQADRRGNPRAARATSSWTWLGTPTPIVSPMQISSAPSSTSRARLRRPSAGPARERATERCRHVRAPPPAELPGAFEYRREGSQRLVDRHPDVALREGVARRGEHRQRPCPGGLGAVHPAHVRHQHWIATPVADVAARPAARPRRPAAGSPAVRRSWWPRSRADQLRAEA